MMGIDILISGIKRMIQQVAYLSVSQIEARLRLTLLESSTQILEFPSCNITVFPMERSTQSTKIGIGAHSHIFREAYSLWHDDRNRTQFKAVSVFCIVILPNLLQTILQLTKLYMPVHGGDPTISIQALAKAFR